MACTAIITKDGIDQIIEHVPGYMTILARELRDLRAMDIGKVTYREFFDESEAYQWEETQRAKGRF